MKDSDSQLERAKTFLRMKDYDNALIVFESVIEDKNEEFDPSLYFGAAYIYEHGLSSKNEDFEKALNYYRKALLVDDASGGAVSLAIARTMFKTGDKSTASAAMELCRSSLSIKKSPQAHMLLGTIYEHWLEESTPARRHFLEAYKMGMPWGLRFYARSMVRSHNYVRGLLAHLWTSLIAPIYFLSGGDQSIFG